MKTMMRFLVAAIVCVGIAGATGFQNGSFSCGGVASSDPATCGFTVPGGQYWQFLGPDSTAIQGWTVGDAGINWVYEYNRPGYGWETTVTGDSQHYSVGLQGNDGTWQAGTIKQTFDTVSGTVYRMDFLYSGAPAAFSAGKPDVWMSVRAESIDPVLFQYAFAAHPTYAGGANMAWTAGYYQWTAIGSTTTISFESLESGSVMGTEYSKVGGITLDGLTFREAGVPEPGTISMMFGAGLFGLAWLVRRKR